MVLFVDEIQGGEIKVFRAKNKIDQCTIPEYTNGYLVNAKEGKPPNCTPFKAALCAEVIRPSSFQ